MELPIAKFQSKFTLFIEWPSYLECQLNLFAKKKKKKKKFQNLGLKTNKNKWSKIIRPINKHRNSSDHSCVTELCDDRQGKGKKGNIYKKVTCK